MAKTRPRGGATLKLRAVKIKCVNMSRVLLFLHPSFSPSDTSCDKNVATIEKLTYSRLSHSFRPVLLLLWRRLPDTWQYPHLSVVLIVFHLFILILVVYIKTTVAAAAQDTILKRRERRRRKRADNWKDKATDECAQKRKKKSHLLLYLFTARHPPRTALF